MIVATIPVVLFQVTQPMNDVVVAALWMACSLRRPRREPDGRGSLGAFTGLAILVRPNLAPAAVVVGLWLVAATWADGRNLRAVQRVATAFAIAAAPSLAILLVPE